MSSQQIHIAANQRFECICCGRCCRRWHVALSPSEIESQRSLDWRREEGFEPADPVALIHGHPYIAHRSGGECLYLDPGVDLCRIHRRFGEKAKPRGCRVYPLNIASTYWGEVSVTARMDCPAVQQNRGGLLTGRHGEIEEYVRLLDTRGGFSEDQTDGLCRPAVEFLVESLRTRLVERDDLSPARKALTFAFMLGRFQDLGVAFLNDMPTMHEVMPSFVEKSVQMGVDRDWPVLGTFWRAVFRIWLASYLRRDEEMVGRSPVLRLTRTWALAHVFLGGGSLRALGAEHPAVSVRRSLPFPGLRSPQPRPPVAGADEAWECYWRFVASRLSALQFFGPSYYGWGFFTGLRALSQTYAHVLASARCHAADRGVDNIETVDVQYAVGAVDHSFGRSRLLQSARTRMVEQVFNRFRYGRLLAALGWQ